MIGNISSKGTFSKIRNTLFSSFRNNQFPVLFFLSFLILKFYKLKQIIFLTNTECLNKV